MRTGYRWAYIALGLAVVHCGGSSTPSEVGRRIEGTVSGLVGAGLVLRATPGGDQPVSSNDSFAFTTDAAAGTAYAVTVLTQPTNPSQTCTVTGGTGTLPASGTTTIAVACTTNSYRVTGTVTGLAGSGLVLRSGLGGTVFEELGITADGGFAFPTRRDSGTVYAVTVAQQPTSPAQSCSVSGGTGTVGGADVAVSVTCATNTYRVRGTVTGLSGTGLVLRNNGGDDLPILASGSFAFATPVVSGASYNVTAFAQPTGPAQTCSVVGGTGTVGGADVTGIVVNCSTGSFTIGGTVSGLSGSGLILSNSSSSESLVVTASGAFTFAAKVASGTTYTISVQTQPASPTQTCTVTNGTGTVGSANVTNVAVACTTSTFTVGGTVSGLAGTGLVLRNNGGNNLTVTGTGNVPFVFTTPVASGAAYAVTVLTQPTSPSQTCTVTSGTGTVGGANVTSVAIACTTTTYTVGGTVTGLAGTGLVLQNSGGNNLTVTGTGNVPFVFTTPVASGAAYAVTVLTQPTSPTQTCTVTSGTGTVASANVTNVAIACTAPSLVMQKWQAPTTWGGLWDDADPLLVEHATFSSTGLVETKFVANTWGPVGGPPVPTAFNGFAAATRYAGGPFDTDVRYETNGVGDVGVDLLTGDMLVCAVVQPDWNPVTDEHERAIVAKGVGIGQRSVPGGGWVLMQMHQSWCFHYQRTDGATTGMTMAYSPTYFPDQNQPDNGPLNPSYVVVCGGRDGSNVVVAANSYSTDTVFTSALPAGNIVLDRGSGHHMTIGGYANSALNPYPQDHVFGGRVYETAVWNQAASPANIQAKFAAIQGLRLTNGDAAQYRRVTEGAYVGGDGKYHTTWRHGPRIDAKGFLFGLQAGNRVGYPEDLERWTVTPGTTGATVFKDQRLPPNDSLKPNAEFVTLNAPTPTPATPGGSISLILTPFLAPGPVQGQIWIWPVSTTGSVTVRLTHGAGGVASTTQNINLASLTANQWTRVWLTQLTTDANATQVGTVSIEADAGNTAAVSFYAWGVDLTQVATQPGVPAASNLGSFDPGPAMYTFTGYDSVQDALQFPALQESTAATGFCLATEAQPASGLAWGAALAWPRSALVWANGTTTVAQIYVDSTPSPYATPGQLCFNVGSGASMSRACWTPTGATWTAGSKHTVVGCVSNAGAVRLYVDGGTTPVATATATPASVPNLQNGNLLVGDGLQYANTAWQGFVSKAVVCRDNGGVPTACQ